jgi:transcriptional regulator with XRE-family HTH domain
MSSQTYDSKAVARRVKQARESLGLSQADIARRLGLTEAGYGHYERDRQTFTVQQLFELERVLGQSVQWFLGIPTRPDELTEAELRALELFRRAQSANMGGLALGVLEGLTKEVS